MQGGGISEIFYCTQTKFALKYLVYIVRGKLNILSDSSPNECNVGSDLRADRFKKIMLKPKETLKTRRSYLIEKEDLFADLAEKQGTILFLGKYTYRQAGRVMHKRNFVKDAKDLKLWPIKVKIDSTQFPPLQRLQMYTKDIVPENLVVDLKIKECSFALKNKLSFKFSSPRYEFLVIEWLTLQNPTRTFSRAKTPLPGQKHPGLGVGKKVIELFAYLARLNENDGIMVYAAFFHNALLFLKDFKFVNPEKQGEVQAIRNAFSDVPFKQLAWIVNLNCLKDKNGNVYEWKAEEMVHPRNRELSAYFDSKIYQDKVKEVQDKLQFSIDWPLYNESIQLQEYFS